MRWRKSSYSKGNGDCVELGADDGPTVAVRNSKHVDRASLTFPAPAVAAFVASCAAGELDDLAS
ncbi:MAG TPA: DUF397 domain-containing protein [Acidimicrobiales bacterium]|nr:DUF397 domain-containing protein [Acidimicrobiales bacterium]